MHFFFFSKEWELLGQRPSHQLLLPKVFGTINQLKAKQKIFICIWTLLLPKGENDNQYFDMSAIKMKTQNQ